MGIKIENDTEEMFLPISITNGYFIIVCHQCLSCGHSDWSACNVDNRGNIIECDKCSCLINSNKLN